MFEIFKELLSFFRQISTVFKEVYSNMFAKYVEPPFEQHEIEVGSK